MKNNALCCIVTDKRRLSDHVCRDSNCFHNSSGESDIKQISSAYISKLTQLEQEQCLLKDFMILQRWFSIHSVK